MLSQIEEKKASANKLKKESSKKEKLIEELKLQIYKYKKERIGYLNDQENFQRYANCR